MGGFRLYDEKEVHRLERILWLKGIGYLLASIRELLAVRDAAKETDKATLLREVARRLKEPEQDATVRIQRMQNDLKPAEALRKELRRDIALCERRIEDAGQPDRLTREPAEAR